MNRELMRWLLVFFLVWVMIVVWETHAAEQTHNDSGATGWVKR